MTKNARNGAKNSPPSNAEKSPRNSKKTSRKTERKFWTFARLILLANGIFTLVGAGILLLFPNVIFNLLTDVNLANFAKILISTGGGFLAIVLAILSFRAVFAQENFAKTVAKIMLIFHALGFTASCVAGYKVNAQIFANCAAHAIFIILFVISLAKFHADKNRFTKS